LDKSTSEVKTKEHF